MNSTALEKAFQSPRVFPPEEELFGALEALVKKVKVYKKSHYYAYYDIPSAREEAFKKLKEQFDAINESLWERIIKED